MPPVAVQEVQHLSAALVVTAETMRQQAAERERRLLAEADVAERAQREEAQGFLAEASTLLSSSLDPSMQLEHLARLLVPTLADWCSIDLLQDDGRIHRVAVVHADPAKAALAEQLRQQYPLLAADAAHTLVRVLRTGESWFDPAASAARLRAEARDTAHWELIQPLGFTAEIVVPLLARGRALGTITCVLGDRTRRYSKADLVLAEDLAGRAALALDNARLYQEAQATQAALEQANATLQAQGEQWRVITDSIPGSIAYVDRTERYRFVNAAYERRFGVPRTQILGRTIRDLRAPIYPHLQPYPARALAGEPVTFENTYERAADAPAL
jgi:PAS domain-containing protein